MWYILIAIGIIWVISNHNDKHPVDDEIVKAEKERWVNELIENL